MQNLKPTLEKLYPEGYQGGQCGAFAHMLVEANNKFPALNILLAQKKVQLRQSGYSGTPYIGDVILQNLEPFGHIAIVNNVIDGKFQLTESNYSYNFRVSHKRLISVADPSILGYWRGDNLYTPLSRTFRICLVQQNSKWDSMANKFAEIRHRVFDIASQGKVDVNIDVVNVNFSNIPFVFYGDGIKGIDQNWLKQTLSSYAIGYHAVCFLVPTYQAQPHGVVFGYSDGDGIPPYITQVFADENEIISGDFGSMNSFVNTIIHENFGHVMKLIDGGPDVTHDYLNNAVSPTKFDLTGLINTYNYKNIDKLLN